MKDSEIQKLNFLFEKMVSESASEKEQKELTSLYNAYIDEGRVGINNIVYINAEQRVG